MIAAFAIIVAGVLLFAAARIVLLTPPETLARWLRRAGPIALIGAGGVLALLGRSAIGLPLVLLGLGWLKRAPAGTWESAGSGAGGERGASTVRSRYFEMTLDHDTGDLDGTVLAGRWRNRTLTSVGERDLLDLREEVSDDLESLRLLETYLDRRMTGWRDGVHAGVGDGLGGAPGAGPMTQQEAYEVLGLEPGATLAEVRDAHRRLMKRVHPDHGGTDFLAARINEAKAVLIDRHH